MSDGVGFASKLWREGFTQVPNCILLHPDLSGNAKLVFAVLSHHAWGKDGAFPGQATIATEAGISPSTVKRALVELEDLRVVRRTRRGQGRSNYYTLDPEQILMGQADPSGEVTVSHEEHEGEEQEGHPPTPQEELFQIAPVEEGPDQVKIDCERVWDHYVSKPGKRVIPLPAQERKMIRDVLKVATADELCRSIDQCWESDFHMKRGEYRDRDGQVYNKLSQIIRGRRGKETDRERIDYWLERESENAVGAGSGFPSADPAVIARRKQDVQRGHRLKGDVQAVRKAEEAEAWLRTHGIETIRDAHEDGYPTFGSLTGVG